MGRVHGARPAAASIDTGLHLTRASGDPADGRAVGGCATTDRAGRKRAVRQPDGTAGGGRSPVRAAARERPVRPALAPSTIHTTFGSAAVEGILTMSSSEDEDQGRSGRVGWEVQKQDRRRRHTRAAKALSAHGFARHGHAGVGVPRRAADASTAGRLRFSPKFLPKLVPKFSPKRSRPTRWTQSRSHGSRPGGSWMGKPIPPNGPKDSGCLLRLAALVRSGSLP